MANLHLVRLSEVDKNRVNVDKRGMGGAKTPRKAKSSKHEVEVLRHIEKLAISEIHGVEN